MKTPIEVDSQMLGPEFNGNGTSIRAFADILSEVTGLQVKAITDITNGARNDWEGGAPFNERQWEMALDIHMQQRPDDWK